MTLLYSSKSVDRSLICSGCAVIRALGFDCEGFHGQQRVQLLQLASFEPKYCVLLQLHFFDDHLPYVLQVSK